jgi:hypothetical protein
MAEWIFMKFQIGEFYPNLCTYSNSGENPATIIGTLHEIIHAFLHMEVTGWKIYEWIQCIDMRESLMKTSSII